VRQNDADLTRAAGFVMAETAASLGSFIPSSANWRQVQLPRLYLHLTDKVRFLVGSKLSGQSADWL
jgi:hypothetical protein